MGNPKRLAWSLVWRNRTILSLPHRIFTRWADSCSVCLQSLLWENLRERVRERLTVALKVQGSLIMLPLLRFSCQEGKARLSSFRTFESKEARKTKSHLPLGFLPRGKLSQSKEKGKHSSFPEKPGSFRSVPTLLASP